MSSKNCGKNLHACQWERDIFFFLALFFLVLNISQVAYAYRSKIYNVLRRGANRIPVENDEDEHPILNVRE